MMIIDSLLFVLPFGKYKGKTIDHVLIVDPSYVEWMNKQDNMVFTAKMLGKIRKSLPVSHIEYDEEYEMQRDIDYGMR